MTLNIPASAAESDERAVNAERIILACYANYQPAQCEPEQDQ